MPERFKVTKAEEPDAEAVNDQLLPNYEQATSTQEKGIQNLFFCFPFFFYSKNLFFK